MASGRLSGYRVGCAAAKVARLEGETTAFGSSVHIFREHRLLALHHLTADIFGDAIVRLRLGIAVPVGQLKQLEGKIVLPGATKDALLKMPEFKYAA